jgi:hypothetical protein
VAYDVGSGGWLRSPTSVNDHWTRIGAEADSVGHHLVIQAQLVGWTSSDQRPISDPDGREVQGGTKVERQAGAARVVAAGGVHHQHIRVRGIEQPAHHRSHQAAFA